VWEDSERDVEANVQSDRAREGVSTQQVRSDLGEQPPDGTPPAHMIISLAATPRPPSNYGVPIQKDIVIAAETARVPVATDICCRTTLNSPWQYLPRNWPP
jgi:hypothetical protein